METCKEKIGSNDAHNFCGKEVGNSFQSQS